MYRRNNEQPLAPIIIRAEAVARRAGPTGEKSNDGNVVMYRCVSFDTDRAFWLGFDGNKYVETPCEA